MFSLILTTVLTTVLLAVSIQAQQCPNNITLCSRNYNERVINPMGLGYISFNKLKLSIRYYNYKLKNLHRRTKRRFSTPISSYSEELSHMEHICDIHFDKINLDKIKFKYIYANRLYESIQTRQIYFMWFAVFIILYPCTLLYMML